VHALGILILIVFFKMALEFAYRSWQIGEYSNSSIWRPLVWPIKATIPVAVGLLILQSIAELVRALVRLSGVPFDDPRSDTSQ
jgi:TRAP-type mannitol/chloroaromatic compound transport system permease small subunit